VVAEFFVVAVLFLLGLFLVVAEVFCGQ